MKIGVIADTHIPDRAKEIPRQVLEAFRGVDMVIHAGDMVDLKVLEQLKAVCSNVKAVWGNMDPYEVKKALPEKEVIQVGSIRIGVMHGYGLPSKLIGLMAEVFKNENVNLIIFGHSHSAVNEKRGNIIYFNPGSATDKIFALHNSYGIIEINDKIEAKIIKL